MEAEKKRALFKRIGYEPHSPEQWECHLSEARFKIPCCGRRWGKTTFGGRELTAALLDLEKPDGIYWIVGPDYSLGEKEFRVVFNDVVRTLGGAKNVKKSYNPKQGDMTIEMPWGTKLLVKSADRKDGLIGEGLDGVVMAEAATHDVDTWQMYIEPALSDKRGWAIFPSTPRGYNWFQGLWMMGQLPDFPEYESWRLPTWTNLTKYPVDTEPDAQGCANKELQRIKRSLPEITWMQEYSAEFTTYEGKIYTEFNPKVHVTDIKYNPVWKNYLFFDYGFVDPFVCLDVMVDPMGKHYIWREYQVSGMTTWEHGRVIRNRDNPKGYHIDGMYGDPRGADEAATLALILGPVVSEAVASKLGIEAVKKLMKIQPDGSSLFAIDRSCVDSIRQFERLHWKAVKGDRNAKEEQHDYDDHGPDAFRYGVNFTVVLGQGGSLSDVYSGTQQRSEAYSFLTRNYQLVRDSGITR